jgi:hypothetical protein
MEQQTELNEKQLLKMGYSLFPWGYVNEKSPLIRFSLNPKEKYWIELGNGFRIQLPYVQTLEKLLSLIKTTED